MPKDRVRIGCDPEIFLIDKKGTPVPITGMIGGTKHQTVPLLSLLSDDLAGVDATYIKKAFKSPEFGILEDGVCLEFNTPSFNDWDRWCHAIGQVQVLLEAWAASKGLRVAYNMPEAEFNPEIFEKHSELKQIGCSPDFDAYGPVTSRRPITHETLGNKRFSGGHIHLGYNVELVPPYVMAKFLDLILGLPLIILGEKQKGRRRVYGQAGLYRPKPYGVEYRTPSNIWLQYAGTNSLMYLAAAVLALGRMVDKQIPLLKAVCAQGVIPWQEVQRAFATEDRNLAIDLFQYINKQFPDLMATSAGAFRNGYDPVWDPDYKQPLPTSKAHAPKLKVNTQFYDRELYNDAITLAQPEPR